MKNELETTTNELIAARGRIAGLEESLRLVEQEKNIEVKRGEAKEKDQRKQDIVLREQFSGQVKKLQERINSLQGENQSLTVFKEKEQALSQQRDQFQSLLQSQLADREKRFQHERMQFVQNEGEERRKEVEKVRAAYEAKLRELVTQHEA